MAQRYLPGKIIRHKDTGKALLVIHVYRFCTIVIDPTESRLPIPRVLLERDYGNWLPDEEFDCKQDAHAILEPTITFVHHVVSL